MAFIRYQTVRNIGIGVLGAGAIAGIVVAASGSSTPTPAPTLVSTPTPASAPSRTPAPAVTPTVALDDATIAARGDQPASPGEKIKDAFKGNPTKVNLYEETQDTRYDRLKIDANRDDVWDVQWTRDDAGRWQREDGQVMLDGHWQAVPTNPQIPPTPMAAPTPSTPATATTASEPFAAQLETVANTMLEGKATSEKLKDLFRGNGPKVNLYDDDKDGRWDRAKIDFDRDEVDDEKLTQKGGFIERKSEKTGAITTWDNGVWKPKP